MYYSGKGVPKDEAEAAKWYRKAADQGNADAQFGLGGMYYYGQGMQKNDAEAAMWLRKAAAQGNTSAQSMLDSMQSAGALNPDRGSIVDELAARYRELDSQITDGDEKRWLLMNTFALLAGLENMSFKGPIFDEMMTRYRDLDSGWIAARNPFNKGTPESRTWEYNRYKRRAELLKDTIMMLRNAQR